MTAVSRDINRLGTGCSQPLHRNRSDPGAMKLPRPGRVATINVSIAAVLVIALVVGFVILRGSGTSATASTQRTATVAAGDVTATVSATGTSEPTSTTAVSFTSTGTIAAINVK